MLKNAIANLLTRLETPEPTPVIIKKNSSRNILIIDGMNLFMKCFTTISTVNKSGYHVGGLLGSLNSLASTVRAVRPDEVIIIFDGEGGSDSRKNLYPDYKGNRHKKKVTNFLLFENLDVENEAKQTQLERLIDYLRCVPIKLICVDNYEADDVIAYLAKDLTKGDDTVTICSTDKDYIQLLNDKIKIYNSVLKQTVDEEYVFKKYGIYPKNFLVARVITGDKGDNIPNVNGIQLDTLLKRFPFMADNEKIELERILEYSRNKMSEKKPSVKYSSVLNFEYQLHINYKLMDLSNIFLLENDKLIIHQSLELLPTLNVFEFNKLLHEDLIEAYLPNASRWLYESFYFLKNKES